MQTEDIGQRLDDLQGRLLTLADQVEGMLIQAVDLLSICEWIIHAIQGEDHVTPNV